MTIEFSSPLKDLASIL